MKMIFMKKLLTTVILFTIIIANTGCEKYLEETIVPTVSYGVYQTEKGIEGALAAAYSSMRLGVTGERALTLSDAGTDLFTAGSDGNTEFNQYLATLSPRSSRSNDYWDYHYKGISECNVTLRFLPDITMNTTRKLAIEGEAKFIRSYFYFNLVQHFGKVPIVLDAIDEAKTDFKRSEVKDVYKQIISDLTSSYSLVPIAATARGRVNKAAVAHLLSKVYLARASAVSPQQRDIRGTQSTDLDSVIYYADNIVSQKIGAYSLQADFAAMFDINNQVNSEVIFAVQFTNTLINNGSGNQQHLYHVPQYDAVNTRILVRSIPYGRPYRRVRPTPYVYNGLFGATRKFDSRFVKSFVWGYIANQASSNVKTTSGNTINVKVGDTAIYFSPVFYTNASDSAKLMLENNRFSVYYPLNFYLPFSRNFIFPGLSKWLDSQRPTTNETNGGRDWVMYRYAETMLILAEAYGRKGDFTKAATYINMIRTRAAYKLGEMKTVQYWTFEGGSYDDRTKSTIPEMQISAANISNRFVDFMLEERGRELLGELNRWEDLNRCEKLVERVKLYNPDAQNIRDFHVLRPIPQTHIDRLNPKGTNNEDQNVGYY